MYILHILFTNKWNNINNNNRNNDATIVCVSFADTLLPLSRVRSIEFEDIPECE